MAFWQLVFADKVSSMRNVELTCPSQEKRTELKTMIRSTQRKSILFIQIDRALHASVKVVAAQTTDT